MSGLTFSQARGNAGKKSSKAPAFEVYCDNIESACVKAHGTRLNAGKTKQAKPPRQDDVSAPAALSDEASQALGAERNSVGSAGGWEVHLSPVEGIAEAVEGERRMTATDSVKAESSSNADNSQQADVKMESGVEATVKTTDDKTKNLAVDDKVIDTGMQEEGASAGMENQPAGNSRAASVDEALCKSDLGREMIEGEQAVALVADLVKGSARGAGLPIPASPTPRQLEFDIDAEDRLDEFCVTEYTEEIYTYLRQNERRSLVDPDYMSRQGDINAKMRVILNDWLVEVHLKFKLRQETLYLCFQLIDRFLEHNEVRRQKLQLVGVTGLMLASKYEEIYPPEVRDYVYICDNAYTRDEILMMEQTMLAKLEYRLSLPTVWCFMKRFCKAAGHLVNQPDTFFHLISYLIELSMIQIRMLQFTPSNLVAASIYFSNTLRAESECWTEQLQHHTGYTVPDLELCVDELRALLRDASKEQKYKAVFKKFSHKQFDSVALEYGGASVEGSTPHAEREY